MWFINLLLALAVALAPEQASADTWDYAIVRADMFAGLGGDAARFTRAMEACERTLARLLQAARVAPAPMAEPLLYGPGPAISNTRPRVAAGLLPDPRRSSQGRAALRP